MWRRIYQRKLLFWIGMYLSIAFGSALQGFTQHQPIYVWTANVVFSLLIVFLWHKFSGYIQEVRGHSLQDKLILVFLFALSNVMLACSAWQSLGYLWLLPVIMVSIGSGIEQSVILFIALLSQNLLLHSASFSARELLIVTFFGFVCIWLLSQELTGRVLSYVGILMLVLESVLQILRHQFMLPSILQEFKNTPQKILMEYGSIILLFLFVWWYVFYRQHSGKMTETELAKQQELNKKLSLILEADFGLLLRLQEFSGQLFIHSMTISSVSAQAARHMGGPPGQRTRRRQPSACAMVCRSSMAPHVRGMQGRCARFGLSWWINSGAFQRRLLARPTERPQHAPYYLRWRQ